VEGEEAGGAPVGLLQGDLDVDLLVRAPAGPGTPGAGTIAEEGREEVREAAVRVLAREPAVRAARAVRPRPGRSAGEPLREVRPGVGIDVGGLGLLVALPVGPEAIVQLALLGVAQDLVRLVDLLEARLGLGVAGVDVGVVLARELAERGADRLLARLAPHAQYPVVVPEVHPRPPPGRRAGAPAPRHQGSYPVLLGRPVAVPFGVSTGREGRMRRAPHPAPAPFPPVGIGLRQGACPGRASDRDARVAAMRVWLARPERGAPNLPPRRRPGIAFADPAPGGRKRALSTAESIPARTTGEAVHPRSARGRAHPRLPVVTCLHGPPSSDLGCAPVSP
jgi:hypothetical protein